MRELRDLRADRLGIRLPGQRVIDPFPGASAEGGPELEELFRLTRPDKKKPRMHQLPTAGVPMTPPPVKHTAPVAVQKAAAHYPRKVAP